MHPMTMRFGDPALERQFREDRLDASRHQARISWAIVGFVLLVLGLFDSPIVQNDEVVGVVRLYRFALTMPIVLLAAAIALSPAWYRRFGMASSVLASLAILMPVPLTSVHVPVAEYPTSAAAWYHGLLGFLFASMFVHVASGLRFITSAVLTLGATVLFVVILAASGPPEIGADEQAFVLVALAWLVGANAVGLTASYAIEANRRREFLGRKALEREQERSDRLLLNVLPASVAARLKETNEHVVESFDSATILFADLVGFTELARRLPPSELIRLLDRLFSGFDEVAERLGVEKIKTVGDAYMAVAGVPVRQEDHTLRAARMAMEMQQVTARVAEQTGLPLQLRVGIHVGPVVAGVLGTHRFAYDLWGDAVNTASRLESHGLPGEIQVSDPAADALRAHFDLELRGEVQLKGQGLTRTWLLRRSSAAQSTR